MATLWVANKKCKFFHLAVEALLDELDNTVSHSKTSSQVRPVQGRAAIVEEAGMPRTGMLFMKKILTSTAHNTSFVLIDYLKFCFI